MVGTFPQADSVRIRGSYGMRDDAVASSGDGVIRINGTEVLRIDPGPGPPFDGSLTPFDIDVTAFAGRHVMLEFACEGEIRLSEGAEWVAPEIVVTGRPSMPWNGDTRPRNRQFSAYCPTRE